MNCIDTWFIWTDFGGVLTPPVANSLVDFCRKHDLDPGDLIRAMGKVADAYGVRDPMELLDRPVLPEAEWITEVNRHLDRKLPLTTLADDWFDQRETNEAWVHVLRGLRSPSVRVGMLSNMVPAWDSHWRRMINTTELFDHVMLSFEVGFRKPEPELFAVASGRAGVSPERCILVDDLEQNCVGAAREGWHAVHFRDAESAEGELLQILIA